MAERNLAVHPGPLPARLGAARAGAGFTLLELVLTLVVLGVLAAVMLPRFVDLKKDGRATAVKTGASAVVAAARMVHLRAIAAGVPMDATIRQVDIGGGDQIDVRYGYPTCTVDGIPKASGTDSGTSGYVWYIGPDPGMCTLYPDTGKDGSGHTIYLNNCGAMYVNSSGTTWTPITSGC